MIFKWPTREEKIVKGMKISPGSKLEGLRAMNELQDRVLTAKQKKIRRKLREARNGRGE